MRNYLTLCTILLFCQSVIGQVSIEPHANYILPGKKLDEAKHGPGYGAGISVLAPISFEARKALKLQMGGILDFSWHGRQDEAIPFDADQADLYVRNEIWALHGTARLILATEKFPIYPFVGGLIGTRYFRASERITYDSFDAEDDITTGLVSDFVLSYGGEVGMLIPLSVDTFLKLSASLFDGGFAEFIDLETVEETGVDSYDYEIQSALSQQFAFKLGVHILIE